MWNLTMSLLLALACGQAADAENSSFEPIALQAPSQQGRSTPAQPRPPAFHNLRFEENRWDWRPPDSSLKYIPLNDSGSAYLSLGGQIRVRTEFWDSFGFLEAPSRDDTFGLLRVRLHGDLYLGPHFRFFVEGKSALATDRELPGGKRILDVDHIALQNALIDLKAPAGDDGSFTLRVGRQELQFGKQRLVSPLDWSNTRPRSFDALRGILKMGDWRLDAFFGNHVRVRQYDFNRHDSGTGFFGAYLSGKVGKRGWTTDFYWLGLDRDRSVFGGVGGDEQRQTLGARLAGRAAGGFDFDVEGAFQFGDHAGRDIRAAMFGSQFGWTFAQASSRPRVYLGFDFATGDGDPSDGDVGTFNQLFPLGHAYLGFIDAVGRQNILDLSGGVSLRPVGKLNLRVDVHRFWRADEADALYNVGGGVARAGFPGSSKDVGTELDFTLSIPVIKGVVVSGGISRFFAGDFIRQSGPDDNMTFGHMGIQYTF